MPSEPSAEERAKAIRQTHFLNIALAGRSGQSGDIETACKYTVEAIVHAIKSAERATANRVREEDAKLIEAQAMTLMDAIKSATRREAENLLGILATAIRSRIIEDKP
jgi:hypothetical protein